MKGIVFTEFLEMVEKTFDYQTVDSIIEKSQLPNDGAYTSIGTYPHEEMVTLVSHLSNEKNIPVDELLRLFGHYLFEVFESKYSDLIKASSSAFELFESIENYIHVEVKKIYPEAELPSFESKKYSSDFFQLRYFSQRKMSALALGLIEKTLEHFGEKGKVETKFIEEDGSVVEFSIRLQEG